MAHFQDDVIWLLLRIIKFILVVILQYQNRVFIKNGAVFTPYNKNPR